MENKNKNKQQLPIPSSWLKIVLVAVGLILLFFIINIFATTIYVSDFQQEQASRYQSQYQYIDPRDLEIPGTPSIGAEEADVAIVEFVDFQCPVCKRNYQTVRDIVRLNPDRVRLSIRNLPIFDVHTEAVQAAMAAHCADDQEAFWRYHDLLFENQDQLDQSSLMSYAEQLSLDTQQFNACLTGGKYRQRVEDDVNFALSKQITSTPTWFINGYKISGYLSAADFEQHINEIMSLEE